MKIAIATETITGTAIGPNGDRRSITVPEGKYIANCTAEYKAGTWTIEHLATRKTCTFDAPETAFQIKEIKA